MNKRGELTSTQIVFIILAIVGFIIVALLFSSLFLEQGALTQRELCKLSLIERATIPIIGNKIVPVQCSTEKICITSKGNECEQFIGEENVRNVRINSNKPDEAREIIERESANAMFDCWSMTGEGKIDIFDSTDSIVDLAKPKCIVCSRVAISEEVDENILEEIDLNKYLAEKKVPGSSLTYLQTFTDGLKGGG